MPRKYSCQGEDISPALSWTEPPAGTRSFALDMYDPDAPGGGWHHWLIYNVPASIRGLAENQPTTSPLPNGAVQGSNSWGDIGYGGPCPPSGPAHRYQFRLYALNTTLDLGPGATRGQFLFTIPGRVLSETMLTGLYARQ
ncbi:MAG: YbhB/YbcL family Raf kinase inhibitor-like protein [Chloroflexi bacterium]|nr:YbhB/YbcL family Raf kinase inhibitor-like protein [Chloroflexota bacterium]